MYYIKQPLFSIADKIKWLCLCALPLIGVFNAQAQYSLKKVSTMGAYAERADFSFINDSVGFYCAGTRILKTSDRGETWVNYINNVSSLTKPSAAYISGYFVTEKIGWVVLRQFDGAWIKDSSFLYKTTDGGLSWTLQRTNPPNAVAYAAATFWKVYFKNSLEGWIFGKGLLEHTKDGGKTWTTIIHEIGNEYNDNILQSIHFADDNNGYLVGYGSWILHSSDGGNTWSNQHYYSTKGVIGDGYFIYDVAFANKDTGMAVIGHGLYKRTFDAGKTWIDLSTGLPDDNNTVIAGPNNTFWMGAGDYCDHTGCYESSALMYSTDWGNTWISMVDNDDNNKFIALEWPSKTYGFAATRRGEIYKLTAPTTTSLHEQSLNTTLLVYPNPVLDKLYMGIPDGLDYYMIEDMLGRVWMKGERIAGQGQFVIDLQQLAPGNYILKSKQTNHLNVDKAMIITKLGK